MFDTTSARWVVLVGATLSSAGCASMMSGIVEAVTGKEVVVEGDASVATSVHLRGPTPGWERQVLRPIPFEPPSALFDVGLFSGVCPGLYFAGGHPTRPPLIWTRHDFELIEVTPSDLADVDFYRFGEVSPNGPPDPLASGILNWVPPPAAGACTSVGLPLVTFRRPVRPSALQ